MTERTPITLTCPQCAALNGEPCRTRWGRLRRRIHAARSEAWWRVLLTD